MILFILLLIWDVVTLLEREEINGSDRPWESEELRVDDTSVNNPEKIGNTWTVSF